jgi:uncharacterized protein (DUF488 family)
MITATISRYNIEKKKGNPIFFNSWRIALHPSPYYNDSGKPYLALAPSKELLTWWNKSDKGEEAQAKFTKRYTKETLSQLDPRQVYADLGEDAVLLCFEKPGVFCHRRIVAKWLEDNLGISVPEYTKP